MLHLNTIDTAVHHLLLKFSSPGYLNNFALAGGTSLSLQIGHRKSIDIEMFAFNDADMQEVSLLPEGSFEKITIRKTSKVFIFCTIDSVKCDFVKHSNHRLVKPIITIDGIRMYSREDIAAMKLNAICGRGVKKDFYVIYSLLQQFSLKEMLEFYDYKFKSDNSWMALRSLQYFEDADGQEVPELISPFPNWEEIKKYLINEVNNFRFNV
ncbi:MAG: nucleotidyl transferase AbiEii/AbiGii toxin family protein [Bacteroidota bacterium]